MPSQEERVPADLVIRDAAEIVTCKGAPPLTGPAMGEIHRVPSGWIASHRGRIVFVGDALDFRQKVRPTPGCRTIDASGKTLLPGFIDPHSHLIFAGERLDEFERRVRGESYEKIHAEGGGILSTVEATRAAGEKELLRSGLRRLDRMLLHGTTTVEAKSGYGLEWATERKMLEVIRRLREVHPVEIAPTFLGAHAIPREYADRRGAYVDLLVEEMLPKVRQEGLAESCDVFCDEGAFTLEETRRILATAKELGLGLRVHAEELQASGGAELAAELGALSAEHLVHVSSAAIGKMAAARTTAVLLPGTTFFLMKSKYAPALRLIDAGVPVAIGSDFNPGSCPTLSLPAVGAVAVLQMRMSPAQALHAMTINAAWALRRHHRLGSLEVGKQMDCVLLDAPDHRFLFYHWALNLVDTVVKAGRPVVENRRLCVGSATRTVLEELDEMLDAEEEGDLEEEE